MDLVSVVRHILGSGLFQSADRIKAVGCFIRKTYFRQWVDELGHDLVDRCWFKGYAAAFLP